MKKAGSPGPPRKNKAIYFQARIGFSLQDLPHLVPADKLIPGIITNANSFVSIYSANREKNLVV